MADSVLTKKALAAALKRSMETKPFSKISVGDLCGQCGMNRKSFYYHFKDKYELLWWIYETEFMTGQRSQTAGWEKFEEICRYFYENREFYRKSFGMDGQNSFSEYFWEILREIIREEFSRTAAEKPDPEFFLDFYTDAFLSALRRWLADKNGRPPDVFTSLMYRTVCGGKEE